MAALGMGMHGRGSSRQGHQQPATKATSDFLAHTGEFMDPASSVQHGSTSSHATYDPSSFHGRTRGCAHVGGAGQVYLDQPDAAVELAMQKRASARVQVKLGGLEQERHGRGQHQASPAQRTSDFFTGSYAVDPRKEKRGEARPLDARFADPHEYAHVRRAREEKHADVRQEQISQIETRAAERAAQRRFSQEDARTRDQQLMLNRVGGPTEDEVARSNSINERYREKKVRDVESDPYRSAEGKRERRAISLLDPVVGGSSGFDKWYDGSRHNFEAHSVKSRGMASRSRFENTPNGVAQASQSLVDTQMRKDGALHVLPDRTDDDGVYTRRHSKVSNGRYNFDHAVPEDEWVHKNVGKSKPQPRHLQDFELREQRFSDALPRKAHENPTQDVLEPRGKGRVVTFENPEFLQRRRPTHRW
eukprot:m.73708 g.73708  ORF g.73708 m.73708 type:complete len:419 (+) comp18829_c0_seq3:225-1481(+)